MSKFIYLFICYGKTGLVNNVLFTKSKWVEWESSSLVKYKFCVIKFLDFFYPTCIKKHMRYVKLMS